MNSLEAILDFVEENKLDMSENTYLEMCNLLKTRYDRSSFSSDNPTLHEIQQTMHAFDKEHGDITEDDMKRGVEQQIDKRKSVAFHFVVEYLYRLKELIINDGYISSNQELRLLCIEERNRRCRNHVEYVKIKQMFECYYNVCPYMGLYD